MPEAEPSGAAGGAVEVYLSLQELGKASGILLLPPGVLNKLVGTRPSGEPKIWLAKPGNSPFWVIRYEDSETGRVQQKSTGTAKKKEAERVLGAFRADLLNGRYRGSANGTWEAFRQKYEAEVLSGLAQKTVKKADVVLDAVERLLKPKKLSDLTASRISQFIAELRDGKRSESTIAGYLAHLRAVLS